jgi:hypothetical protein
MGRSLRTPRVPSWTPHHDGREQPHPFEAGAVPLKGAVQLCGPACACALHCEEVLIGRHPSCQLVIDDPLVSREHARLTILADKVLVQDCRSANGLYVNNVRVFEPYQLYEGDRLLLGTTELCVFGAEPPLDAPQESSRVPAVHSDLAQPPAVTSTARAAALEVLGKLAGRKLAEGKPTDAEWVLADHLAKILDGARVGLEVPEQTCRAASHWALNLAGALRHGSWIDYTLELHLCAQLPMAPQVAAELAHAAELVYELDHGLYHQYVQWLRNAASKSSCSTNEALERLERIRLPGSRRGGQ